MKNINQWQFDELPNSKIIITEEVLSRLQFLIGRTSLVTSEHRTTLFGKKINDEDTWLIDGVNVNEDYLSIGTGSNNPKDYAVEMGINQYREMIEKANPGSVIIDIHTHPSGLIEDYRFISGADISAAKSLSNLISSKGGTAFSGLIGCDSIDGNMSFSIIWFNKLNNTFYRVQNIFLRKELGNGEHRDILFPKYDKTQLIMQNCNDEGASIDQTTINELNSFGRRYNRYAQFFFTKISCFSILIMLLFIYVREVILWDKYKKLKKTLLRCS